MVQISWVLMHIMQICRWSMCNSNIHLIHSLISSFFHWRWGRHPSMHFCPVHNPQEMWNDAKFIFRSVSPLHYGTCVSPSVSSLYIKKRQKWQEYTHSHSLYICFEDVEVPQCIIGYASHPLCLSSLSGVRVNVQNILNFRCSVVPLNQWSR